MGPAAALASNAGADLVYTSQERTIAVGDRCENVAMVGAPGFASFHAFMHEEFKPRTVAQDSWLRVGFVLTEAVGFRLWGAIDATYEGSGDSVDFSGPGTSIHFGAPSLVRAAGVLESGSYTLSIRLWSVDVVFPDEATGEVWFSVPSPSAALALALGALSRRRRTPPV